jgi:tetratricopeptide (TPR) repeat protein
MAHPQTVSPSRGDRVTPLPLFLSAVSEILAEPSRRSRHLLCAGLVILLALGACEQPDAEEFVRRALDFRAKGEISASIIELKNALQQEPRNAQARFLLGQNYLTVRDFAGAEKELLRARDYGFPANQLAEPLAEVWLHQRQFEKVLAEILVPDAASAATKSTLAIARGRARRALGDLDGAMRDFEEALEQDPEHPVALVGRARIAMRLGDRPKIDEAVARAIEVAPDDLNVLALKGDFDFLRGDYASAEAGYEAVVKARPNSIVVRLALARAQIFQGKIDPAKGNLDLVLARAKAHPDASYLRASLALEDKDYERAQWHSEQALLINPDHVQSLLIAGAASYLLNRLEQADRYLSRVLAQDPKNRLARQLHDATRVRIGRSKDQASRVPLLDDSLDPTDLLTLVDAKAKAGADTEAGRAFLAGLAAAHPEAVLMPRGALAGGSAEGRLQLRAELERAPRDVPKLVHLARFEHDIGNDTEAISLLEEVLAANPYAVVPRALLGQLFLHGGRPGQALEVLATALRNQPKHPVLLGLKGLSLMQAGRPSEAKLVFQSLVEVEPGGVQAQYLLALAYRETGNSIQFKERLAQVLRLDSEHFHASLDNIRLMAQAGDLRSARDQIDDLLRIAPENTEVLDLSGTIALLEGETEAAIGLLRRALKYGPSATASLKLAYAQQRAGDGTGSRATLTAWLQNLPGDIVVRMALANKHLAAGEFEQARSHYTKISLVAPNNVVVLNNLAWVKLQLGDIESAREDIERARRLAPDDPRVIDTFGLIQLRSGNAEAAARALRRAAGEAPDSPQVQAHLAQALARQGESAEARKILQRILSDHEDFPGQAEAINLLRELGG